MPAVALGYYVTPAIMRLTRAGMMEVLQSDHIRTARAKGLSRWRVVVRHALRNAIIPVVSLAAVQLGFMLGGSIVIETIFPLNGLGYLAWQSIQREDIESCRPSCWSCRRLRAADARRRHPQRLRSTRASGSAERWPR